MTYKLVIKRNELLRALSNIYEFQDHNEQEMQNERGLSHVTPG